MRLARTLDASQLATTGRHLLAVVDPDGAECKLEALLEREERASHAERFLSITHDRAGGVRVKGRGSTEDAAVIKAALLPLTAPAPAVDEHDGGGPTYDPRDHGARLWDALVRTAQHALDTVAVPDSHGARARLLVTVDHDALLSGVVRAELPVTGDGLDLSPAVVRRLACDAEIVPVVLGSRGEVLDVGRASRTVTVPIWHALVARDRHCAFPGCTRPPVMCHAHHLHHWADGGRTSLDNLVLLCGHHHRVLHHSPWWVRINPKDRRPEFSPPPRLGRDRTWARCRRRADE